MNTKYLHNMQMAMAKAKKMQEHLLESSGVLRAITEAQKMREQLLESSGVLKAITEAQHKMQEHFLKSFDVLRAMREDQRIQNNLALPVLNRLNEIALNLQNVNLIINPDGTVIGTGAVFNIGDVEKIIESCLENTPISGEISLEATFNSFLDNIAKQHPVIKKIIVHILLPIFISMFTPSYFSKPMNLNQNTLVKQIKREVQKSQVDEKLLKEYRFVSCNALNVRSQDSTKSLLVGRLYFGYIVRVVHKKMNWSLIEFQGKDGEVMIRGWVFTRYIKKFD